MKTKTIITIATSCICIINLTSCYSTPGTYTAPAMSSSVTSNSSLPSSQNQTFRPSVRFPARIAFARVESRSSSNVKLINNREYETPEHAKIVSTLPNIAGVTHINNAYLSSSSTNIAELRKATRRLGASLLAIYQFNTSTRTTNGSTVLSIATLGAAPMTGNKAFANASLTFIDAKTGYIYGVLEESALSNRISSSWGAGNARKNALVNANQKAINKLMKRLPAFWETIYTR